MANAGTTYTATFQGIHLENHPCIPVPPARSSPEESGACADQAGERRTAVHAVEAVQYCLVIAGIETKNGSLPICFVGIARERVKNSFSSARIQLEDGPAAKSLASAIVAENQSMGTSWREGTQIFMRKTRCRILYLAFQFKPQRISSLTPRKLERHDPRAPVVYRVCFVVLVCVPEGAIVHRIY